MARLLDKMFGEVNSSPLYEGLSVWRRRSRRHREAFLKAKYVFAEQQFKSTTTGGSIQAFNVASSEKFRWGITSAFYNFGLKLEDPKNYPLIKKKIELELALSVGLMNNIEDDCWTQAREVLKRIPLLDQICPVIFDDYEFQTGFWERN